MLSYTSKRLCLAGLMLLLMLSLDRRPGAEAFNILGICPSTSYSHQQPFQALMKALAQRGHKVTVISPIPLKKPMENYTDIDLSFTYQKEDCTKLRHMSAYEILRKSMKQSNKLCEKQLFSDPIAELIARNETFDAIVIEQLWFQCYYSLVQHYNYPVLIGFLSVGNLPYAMDSVGNPDDPFLNPDMAYAFAGRMDFKERVWNYLYTTYTRIYYNYFHLPEAQSIAARFSPGVSCFSIDRNFSLVILGNNHVFGYPKPLLPNVIEVHSLQITGNPGKLPKDIQEFLNNATDGAVYFSLGSNLQSRQLPPLALKALSDAFGSLKQRVLWKHDGHVSAQADNIKLVEWAPQQAILAHPNVKAYIMQGGLQSMQEAVHYGVPLLALPFFGDQNFNGRKIVDAEIGLILHVDTMTSHSIKVAVEKLIYDPKYSRNIQKMGNILKDEIINPLHKAVWNIEHILKFSPSNHLRYHGHDISNIEYLATYCFIFSIVLFGISLLVWILVYIFRSLLHIGNDVIIKKKKHD
ncbi:UDP-glucuronosyltransferase 1-7-like [Trichogramma pretiosum]|uniref:UDP-glucuronosyltransferase 1-7-like n=1 Tax=Trichogramma pretiosum TaxID=7493 RepID=UPI0006C9BB59|nr:UDP-glucuronosyltransferase 1-7-like [Trichogramma pretiosum]